MSNKKSIEIYSLTEDREKKLWEDCIFVFDTSALLRLYYYLPQILEKIDNIFLELKRQERLWIPQRVEYEYLKNRETKIREVIQQYNNLIKKDIQNNSSDGQEGNKFPEKKDNKNQSNKNKNGSGQLETIEEIIKKTDQIYKEYQEDIDRIEGIFKAFKQKTKNQQHPYFENDSLVKNFEKSIENFKISVFQSLEKIKNDFKGFKDKIEEETTNKEKEIKKNFDEKDKDPVFKIFSYFQAGEEYSFDKLLEIAKEGQVRYESKIPPGYEDKNAKNSIRMYGDLIIWKQIIDYAGKNKKNIILINNDNKEDWWDKTPHKPQPREELIKEFYDCTDGIEIWMYNLSDFIYKANQLLDAKVDQTVLEKVKEIEKEQLKQKEEEIAKILVPRRENISTMPSYHHPQEQDYWQEEIEVENFIGQRRNIRTNLLRVYPESFNTYDAYMDIPMSISPDIQKVISPRLGKIWTVIAGPKKSPIMGYFRGDYTDNAPPAWVFGLSLSET